MPFFRVSLSPPFSRVGYQKKAVFLEPVVKTIVCQNISKGKGNFVKLGRYSSNFCVLEYLLTDFF